MADIDERVVKLTLDNKDFKKDTESTVESLEELKQSLKFEGIGKGFENITDAAKQVDMSPLAKGVEQVGVKFNALTTIADAALRNITDRAINAGERMIKGLTVDQVTSGWSKFEEKTKSVATLLAQGFDMDEINYELDKLNWFTDETSYYFADMVSNISKFTATGKGLKESNVAMQGIALWAALSGQNAQTASNAMYQLSQALGAGYMRLEDYRSIQNASMDTDEFRQVALDTAVALGTLEKTGVNTYRSLVGSADEFTKAQFANSLTTGAWFTSDVMMEVYTKYSSAIGDIFDYTVEHGVSASEAIEQLTGQVDEFGLKALLAGQEARSFGDAIGGVQDAVSTGWMKTFGYIIGDSKQATEFFTDISNALYDVFVEGINSRNEVLKEWSEIGGRELFMESLYTMGRNLLEVFETIREAVHDIFPPMTLDTVVNITNGFAKFTAQLKLSDWALDNIRSAISGVLSLLRGAITVFKVVLKALDPIFQLLNLSAGMVLELAGNIGKLMKSGIDRITSARNMEELYTVINNIAKVVATLATSGIGAIIEGATKIFNIVSAIWGRFQNEGGGITGLIKVISDELYILWDSFIYGDTLLNKIIDGAILGVGGVAAVIGGLIDLVMGLIRGEDLDLITRFGDLGAWAESIQKQFEDWGVADIFDKITASLGAFIKTITDFINELFNAEGDMRIVVTAIKDDLLWLYDLMRSWLGSLSTQDIQGFIVIFMLWQLIDSLKGVNKAFGGVLDSISGTFKAGTKILKEFSDPKANFVENLNSMFKNTKILQIGISIALLVNALKTISSMDTQKLINSALIIGSVAAILTVTLKKLKTVFDLGDDGKDKLMGFAAVFLSLGTTMFLISKAMSEISNMVSGSSMGNIWTTFSLLTLFLAELSTVAVVLSKFAGEKNLLSAAAVTLAMASAIRIIANTVLLFEGIAFNDIISGIAAVSITLATLGGVIFAIGKVKWNKLLAATATLTALTGVIFTLSIAVGALSAIPNANEGLGRLLGLMTGFTVMIAILSALGNTMKKVSPTQILSMSVAMVSLSTSILVLSAACAALSVVPWAGIKNAGLVLAGFVGAIFLLAKIGESAGKGLLYIDAFLLALGATVMMVGGGLYFAAEAMIKFIEVGVMFVGAVIGFGTIIKAMGDEWPSTIKSAFAALTLIFNEFLDMIIALTPKFTFAVAGIISAIAGAIIMAAPTLTVAIGALAVELMKVIASLSEPFMKALVDFVNGLNKYLPDLFIALGDFLANVMVGLGYLIHQAIRGLGGLIWSAITGEIEDMSKNSTKEYEKIVKNELHLVVDSLQNETASIADVLNRLGLDSGDKFATGVLEGLKDGTISVEEAAKQLAQHAVDAANGPDGFDSHSPSKKGEQSGEWYGEGTAVGIRNSTETGVIPASTDMAEAAITSMTDALSAGGDKITDALQNTMTSGIDNFDAGQYAESIKLPGLFDLSATYNQMENLKAQTEAFNNYMLTRSPWDATTNAWGKKGKFEEMLTPDDVKDEYHDAGENAGYEWDAGLGEGISSSGAGRAAAKSKAEEINEAFKDAFDRLSLDETIDDKLYKLWQAKNPGATDAEKNVQEIANQNRKLEYEQKRLQYYQDIYSQNVAAYGEDSMEAVQALGDFIDSQTKVLELQNKIVELQGKTAENSTENAKAFMKFSEAVNESYAYLKAEGFSDEQIRNALAKEAGWTQPLMQQASNLAENGKEAANASANAVVGTYSQAVLNGMEIMIPSVSEIGRQVPAALAQGAVENVGLVEDATKQVNTAALSTLSADQIKPGWLNVGEMMDEGMAEGIDRFADRPATASAKATDGTIESAKAAAGVQSPSTEFKYIGEMLMEGLRQGIMARAAEIAEAAAEAVRAAIRAARAAAGVHSPSTEGEYIGEMIDVGIINGLGNLQFSVKQGAIQVIEDTNKAVEEEVKKNPLDEYIKDYLDGNDSTIVLDVDTSKLDEALKDYQEGMTLRDMQSAQFSEAIKKAKEKMMAMGVMGTNKDGTTWHTESYDQVYRQVMGPILAAQRRVMDSFMPISGALNAAKAWAEAELRMKEIDEKYDTSDIIVNFNQTNTSPKPLSHLDIYRDTKKQLDSFKSSLDKNLKRR